MKEKEGLFNVTKSITCVLVNLSRTRSFHPVELLSVFLARLQSKILAVRWYIQERTRAIVCIQQADYELGDADEIRFIKQVCILLIAAGARD